MRHRAAVNAMMEAETKESMIDLYIDLMRSSRKVEQERNELRTALRTARADLRQEFSDRLCFGCREGWSSHWVASRRQWVHAKGDQRFDCSASALWDPPADPTQLVVVEGRE